MINIAVIDDDQLFHLTLDILSKRSGEPVKLHHYFDAQQALQDLTSQDPFIDVLLLDLNMPLMDGWQFLAHVQTSAFLYEQNWQIYICSSSLDARDHKRAQENPLVKDFLVKPFKMATFTQVVSSVNHRLH